MKSLIRLSFLISMCIGSMALKAQPVADFSWASNCAEIQFIDMSTCDGCTITTWFWDFGDGNTSTDQNPFHWLFAPGVYDVTLLVTDEFGNDTTISYPVFSDQGTLAVTFDFVDPTACQNCDGMITANVTGGTAPYTFNWGGPLNQTNVAAINLCSGLYFIEIMDGNGCVIIENVELGSSGAAQLVLDTIVDVDCLNNNSPGSITLHGTGGMGAYTYEWTDQTGTMISDSSVLTPVGEGIYSVSVSDSQGCGQSASYTIGNTANLYVALESEPANCGPNGSISTTVQGLNPPFSFLWSNGSTTQNLGGMAQGVYYLQVIDNEGCTIEGEVEVGFHCEAMLMGRVYSDTNENCIQDPGEFGIPGVVVLAEPGPYYAITDSLGDYTIFTPELNSTISLYMNNGGTITCPVSGEIPVSVSALGDTSSGNDFWLYFDPNAFDLHIHPGWTGATPGFDKMYWIYYYNMGPAPVSATIRMEYDPALTYLGANLGGLHFAAQNAIEWGPYFLGATSSWGWNDRPEAYFNVPASMSITDTVCTYFEILPIAGDLNPVDNVLDVCEPVTGSHDPNAKAVIPAGEGVNGYILPNDTAFFYTVHFQNNGNDTAFTVIVLDTLSEHLNPATIVPGASSHPYTFTMNGQGNLSFRFDEILLPDSTINEPESHGYFNYSIRSFADLPLGTVIENTAAIYFDFNEPIITNTTVNTLHMPVSINENGRLVQVFPNPATDQVIITSSIKPDTYSVFNLVGTEVLSGIPNDLTTTIDMRSLPEGVYLLEVRTDADVFTERVVVVR
jgi:hypothetical protein